MTMALNTAVYISIVVLVFALAVQSLPTDVGGQNKRFIFSHTDIENLQHVGEIWVQAFGGASHTASPTKTTTTGTSNIVLGSHVDNPLGQFISQTLTHAGLSSVGGLISSVAFTTLYYENCVYCKCLGICNIDHDLEMLLCGDFWNTLTCNDVGNLSPPTTTSAPVTVNHQTGNTVTTIPTCHEFCSLSAVAKSVSISNENASTCISTNSKTSSEAFPMTCCKIDETSKWLQGPTVMSMCDSLPKYSPVAKFVGGKYVEGSAGIFAGCLKGTEHGFQFIHQECDGAPYINHVTMSGPIGYQDPQNYYVITELP